MAPENKRQRGGGGGAGAMTAAVLVAALAAGGYYAHTQGMLEPLVAQLAQSTKAPGSDAPTQAASQSASSQEAPKEQVPDAEDDLQARWANLEFYHNPSDARVKYEDATIRSTWYKGAADYWDKEKMKSYDAVMGGYGHLNDVDMRDSRTQIQRWLGQPLQQKAAGERKLKALDVGAGVGRCSQELLLPMFDEVDLLEPTSTLIEVAKHNLSQPDHRRPEGHRAVNFYQMGLQDFTPETSRYSTIWIQWCLMYVHDQDVVAFLQRAVWGLEMDGLIFVKENVAPEATVMDKTDNSIARTVAHFEDIFQQAGLRVLERTTQQDFSPELYEVSIWTLWPERPWLRQQQQQTEQAAAAA